MKVIDTILDWNYFRGKAFDTTNIWSFSRLIFFKVNTYYMNQKCICMLLHLKLNPGWAQIKHTLKRMYGKRIEKWVHIFLVYWMKYECIRSFPFVFESRWISIDTINFKLGTGIDNRISAWPMNWNISWVILKMIARTVLVKNNMWLFLSSYTFSFKLSL